MLETEWQRVCAGSLSPVPDCGCPSPASLMPDTGICGRLLTQREEIPTEFLLWGGVTSLEAGEAGGERAPGQAQSQCLASYQS